MAALASLRSWFSHLIFFGPKTMGLPEPIDLRFHNVVLTQRDAETLSEGRWLNDAVLDFFLRLAEELAVPPSLCGALHVAKTQFSQRLSAGGAASGERGWENVRTWTRSLTGGVLARDYIIYPVNEENLHWWVAVVCHPQAAMEAAMAAGASVQASSKDMPRIVCMDSMPEPPPKDRLVTMLKGYLRREWHNHPPNGTETDDMMAQAKRWKASVYASEALGIIPAAEVPLQENCYDCGVFALEFVLHLMRHPTKLPALGIESAQSWFSQAVVTHRRRQLWELAMQLQARAQETGEGDVASLLGDQSLRETAHLALTSEPEPEPASFPADAPRASAMPAAAKWSAPVPCKRGNDEWALAGNLGQHCSAAVRSASTPSRAALERAAAVEWQGHEWQSLAADSWPGQGQWAAQDQWTAHAQAQWAAQAEAWSAHGAQDTAPPKRQRLEEDDDYVDYSQL